MITRRGFIGAATRGAMLAGAGQMASQTSLRQAGAQRIAPSLPAQLPSCIREDFPILATKVRSKRLVYLDSAASAQKPRAVLDCIQHVYARKYANVHRGLYQLADAVTEAYEDAREKVGAFVNAERSEEIIFTRNATEAVNLVAYTFGRERVKPGDEIVLSIMEHHSNIVPWHFLRERQGAVIRWAPVDGDGNFLLDEFEQLLNDRTKIVAITQMSNVLGTVVPVKDVIRMAHERGIPVLVDGAQGAVHLDVDVADIDCDFYVFTGHKLYGPSGIGVLYGKYAHLAAMPPFNGGGEMMHKVSRGGVTYAEPPQKFEAGTPPIVQAIGLGAAIDYINSIGRAAIRAHEQALLEYAVGRLREINSLRIIGNARDKGPIISFEMKGIHPDVIDPHVVPLVVDQDGVAIRASSHCATPLHERFGAKATCRASFALYNIQDEVDQLAGALRKAHELLT